MQHARFLLLAALALGSVSVQAATPTSTPSITAGPYDNDYAQGVASAEQYINNGQRSFEEAQAEKQWAENKRDGGVSSLREYYYLSGYIDRLRDYLETGN